MWKPGCAVVISLATFHAAAVCSCGDMLLVLGKCAFTSCKVNGTCRSAKGLCFANAGLARAINCTVLSVQHTCDEFHTVVIQV